MPNIDRTHPSYTFRAHLPHTPVCCEFCPSFLCQTGMRLSGTPRLLATIHSVRSHPRNGRPRRFYMLCPLLPFRLTTHVFCASPVTIYTRPFDVGKIKKNRIVFPGVGRPFRCCSSLHPHPLNNDQLLSLAHPYFLSFASVEPHCTWSERRLRVCVCMCFGSVVLG